jgi:NAD(P)-dependent dehydrogenase (short-subunit alcohol dehydrogenase family)
VPHSSGIGRSVAIQFAREGADIGIVYLPEEEDDAQDTKRYVEKEGKECYLIPGNLMDNKTCKEAVGKYVEKYVELHSFLTVEITSFGSCIMKIRANQYPRE